MKTQRHSLSILAVLTAILILPAVTSAVCWVELDSPALVNVTAGSDLDLVEAPAGTVILEQSLDHLVIASRQAGVLFFETPGCDLQTTVTPTDIRQKWLAGGRDVAVATTFYALAASALAGQDEPLLTLIEPIATIPGKEEDHEIDPDPGFADPGFGFSYKEEDHEIDPDPGFADLGFSYKEEDHEIDPDPGLRSDWNSISAWLGQLGDGWYFLVMNGEVTQEILIEPRR